MKSEALSLVRKYGWSILPVQPGGKIPLIKAWPQLATADENTICDWWEEWPNANIGVATGPRSGIAVLDVDLKHDGIKSLVELRESTNWPETLTAKTGSGGFHFYYAWDEARPLANSAGKLGPGLDIRGDGGYVVAPPSLHANGNHYEWI